MTYPLSHTVSVGDATEAAQYNNLRMDALCLGNDPESSGTLLQLLAAGMGNVRLSRTDLTSITLTASEAEPCALVIGGKIYAVTSDIVYIYTAADQVWRGRLFLSAVPADDGSFTLTAGETVPTGARMIGTFLWDSEGIIPGTVRNCAEYQEMLAGLDPSVCCGRLSASAGSAVPDSDINSSNGVYFVPYHGNKIGLWVGNTWEVFTFNSRLQLMLSTLTRYDVPHDIFVRATKYGLEMTAVPWRSVTTRDINLGLLNGIKVLTNNQEQRYVGTIATHENGYTIDSAAARLIWNEYNRVRRPILAQVDTAAGSSSVSTAEEWLPYFGAGAASVRVLLPDAAAEFELTGVGISAAFTASQVSNGTYVAVGILQDYAASQHTRQSVVPVFTHSQGNGPMSVTVRQYDSSVRGVHSYTLGYWTNNTAITPAGIVSGCGEAPGPGLHGAVFG